MAYPRGRGVCVCGGYWETIARSELRSDYKSKPGQSGYWSPTGQAGRLRIRGSPRLPTSGNDHCSQGIHPSKHRGSHFFLVSTHRHKPAPRRRTHIPPHSTEQLSASPPNRLPLVCSQEPQRLGWKEPYSSRELSSSLLEHPPWGAHSLDSLVGGEQETPPC